MADKIDKKDYFRYISLIKKEQQEIQKDTVLHKALSRTALSLTLNQRLVQTDMKNFDSKIDKSDDVTSLPKDKKLS